MWKQKDIWTARIKLFQDFLFVCFHFKSKWELYKILAILLHLWTKSRQVIDGLEQLMYNLYSQEVLN